jgi:hypothetical protein
MKKILVLLVFSNLRPAGNGQATHNSSLTFSMDFSEFKTKSA